MDVGTPYIVRSACFACVNIIKYIYINTITAGIFEGAILLPVIITLVPSTYLYVFVYINNIHFNLIFSIKHIIYILHINVYSI